MMLNAIIKTKVPMNISNNENVIGECVLLIFELSDMTLLVIDLPGMQQSHTTKDQGNAE